MAIFTGAGVALITPMDENEEVDYGKMKEMIEFQIANGTDAIIICGTTGEASTLSNEEHIECVRACVKYVNKRVPVIAGTGSNSTKTAVCLSKEAEEAGADGLLLVTPYYNKCTQNGLKAHFKAVAEAVSIPIILYNIPGRTGVTIGIDTLIELWETVDNIVGVKDATGDLSGVAEILAKTNCELDVYSGNDDQILPMVALGGKGVISVLSNILPRETHDIVDKFLSGDSVGARDLQLKYFDLIGSLFCEVNPIPVKKAMNLMGMNVGPLRMPLTEMEEKNALRLKASMNNVGIVTK